MIATVIGGRRSIRALADYVLHDQVTADNLRPTTSERVAWTACLGVPMSDPRLMVRCMQGLSADAAILKSLAGVPASGRKLASAYEHVVLSWPEGAKPPSRRHALDAVREALDALGVDDRHRGIVAAHSDTDSPHLHVIFSRVCPETGRAVKVTKPAIKRLQRWCADYERRNGGIVIENRVRRQKAREAFTAEMAALKVAGVPEEDAVDLARDNHPLPRQQPRRGRRSSGRKQHTAVEQAEWRELSERQREQPGLHPGRAKVERVQLARRQARRRKLQKVFAPLKKLAVLKRGPDVAPGRMEPTKTTLRISSPDLQRLEAQISAKRDRTRDELRDAETAVDKADRGAPRRRWKFERGSTTRERKARETFEATVRDERTAQRAQRAAARKHAAARDALAAVTPAASGWTPRRVSIEERLAQIDAEERRDEARDADTLAGARARTQALIRQEARDRWCAAAANRRRERQERRQKGRENRPLRRRLQRRLQRLRQRMAALDTALKAVERVLKRLGLSKRPAPPARPRPKPAPDLSPSLSDIVRDLDKHLERDYPAAVRTEHLSRTERSVPRPERNRQGKYPERRTPQVAEVLIGAVRAGGARLSRARSDFERMDPSDKLKRLVLQAVDPELLEAVVGPRLASTWVKPLRAQYARIKQAHPADWEEVKKTWREQRNRWRPQQQVSPPAPAFNRGHVNPTPPRAPAPAAEATVASQNRGQNIGDDSWSR